MNITGTDIAVFIVCMLFVGAVYFSKVKKHAPDRQPRRPRNRRPPP